MEVVTTNAAQTTERKTSKAKREQTPAQMIASLLVELAGAAKRGDHAKGKKLRRKLRKLGHYGGRRLRESTDPRVTGKRTSAKKAKRTPVVANANASTIEPDGTSMHDSNGEA